MEVSKKSSHDLSHDFSFYCTQKSFLMPVSMSKFYRVSTGLVPT